MPSPFLFFLCYSISTWILALTLTCMQNKLPSLKTTRTYYTHTRADKSLRAGALDSTFLSQRKHERKAASSDVRDFLSNTSTHVGLIDCKRKSDFRLTFSNSSRVRLRSWVATALAVIKLQCVASDHGQTLEAIFVWRRHRSRRSLAPNGFILRFGVLH